MKEEPKSIWKKPWKGWWQVIAWFVLLASAFFVTFFCETLVEQPTSAATLIESICLTLAAIVVLFFLRWLCRWLNLRRVFFGVACLATLVALFYVEENVRGKYAWKAHKRYLEAEGEKFTLTQLAPPPVPDDQNFAMTPFFKPLFDCFPGSQQLRDTNSVAQLGKISAELSDGRDRLERHAFGSLETGTFADLEAWREFYRGNTNYPQPDVSGTAAADIRFALAKFDPEIQQLQEAAATRPYSRFPLEYDLEPAWTILLRHLSFVKKICKLTEMRAVAKLELGQSAEAFDELKLGFRLSDSIRNEPILIDHLVRIRTLTLALQTLREGLVRHAWSDAQLAELEKYLASLNLLAEYKLAMRGERALLTGGLDWLRRLGFRAYTSVIEANGEHEPGFARVMTLMPGGWYYQNMLTISEMFQESNLPMVDEKAHRVFPDIATKSDATVGNWWEGRPKPYDLIAGKLMPGLGTASKKSALVQTFVDAARVACALERYRLAHGIFPETLDALAPRFIESIPTDVIDGKPLRYRQKPDGGYLLYSAGWNQTDDGGEIASRSGEHPRVDVYKGDWVWQMPTKPITAGELTQSH